MNIPPKSIKSQIARTGAPARSIHTGAGAANPQMPSTIRAASDLAEMENVTTESLPVLQAFQDFLETERKHARRQVAAVTAFFLILFILVAGAGTFFGYVYIGKMNTELASLHTELALSKNSIREETSEMLASLAQRTDVLTTRIVDGDELLKKATSQMNDTVSSSLSEKMDEIEEIREALKALEKENRNLRHDLVRIQAAPTVVTSGIDTTMAATAASSPMPLPSPIETVSRKAPRMPTVSKALAPLEMAILAPGSSATMKWRIPISE